MNYQGNLTTKTLKVEKTKSDGARHAVFVASSESVDRDGQSMDLASTAILMKGGGQTLVKDIPAEGLTGVDIPLTLNHSYDVGDVIGSVDKVFYDADKGELTFDARFSSRDKAQDVFTLLEEGHLSNAFSISAFDVELTKDGRIENGTMNAVGIVERGANQDAQLLVVKDLQSAQTEPTGSKTEQVAEESSEAETEEAADVDVSETEKTTEEAPTDGDGQAEAEPDAEEKAKEPEPEAEDGETAPETADGEAEEAKESEEQQTETEDAGADTAEAEEKEGTNDMNKDVAKALVKEPEQKVTVTSTAEKNYLDSKLAMHDFARHIVANKGLSSEAVISSWKTKLAEKGLNGDQFLPTPIVSIFKGWEDRSEILRTFVSAPRAARTIYAFTGENGEIGEDMRAKGHTKGQQKANQVPYLYARDVKGKLIYKKLPLDLQDLLDDESGELSRIRLEELVSRIDDEAERASIVGDGRASATPDYRVYDGTRGIVSMVSDLNLIVAAGTDSATAYAKTVGSVVTTGGTNAYEKAKLALARVAGLRKYVVLPTGSLAELEIARASGSDAYLFPNGVNFGENVIVFERDWVTGSGYDAIAWGADGYEIYLGGAMVRTDFDLDYNLDVVLAERYASGSAKGYKKIAGYKSA